MRRFGHTGCLSLEVFLGMSNWEEALGQIQNSLEGLYISLQACEHLGIPQAELERDIWVFLNQTEAHISYYFIHCCQKYGYRSLTTQDSWSAVVASKPIAIVVIISAKANSMFIYSKKTFACQQSWSCSQLSNLHLYS